MAPMFPRSSAYTKFCDGARQPASAVRNCAKSLAWLTARMTARSGDAALPIQSTDVVCPARVMTGPCTVRSTVRRTAGPPRTGIV
jgi:hypothetical protein